MHSGILVSVDRRELVITDRQNQQHTLTIAPDASISAAITAESVVIEGTVEGDLAATSKILVHSTAKVEGECSAPIVSIAEGAIVQGRIETTQRKSKLAVAS